MDIRFVNPGFEYSLESILRSQEDDTPPLWQESLYGYFPQLQRERAAVLSPEERRQYIAEILGRDRERLMADVDGKLRAYAGLWEARRSEIEAAFSDAFLLNCAPMLNGLTCRVTLNPVSPRYLREQAFDMFYLNSETDMLGIALYEAAHFLWFHVWRGLFGDDWAEYERPSLKWIFGEMAVECMLEEKRLRALDPYYTGAVYPFFFTMLTEDGPILKEMHYLYRTQTIRDFMVSGYEYCLAHESEIRDHIREFEQAELSRALARSHPADQLQQKEFGHERTDGRTAP